MPNQNPLLIASIMFLLLATSFAGVLIPAEPKTNSTYDEKIQETVENDVGTVFPDIEDAGGDGDSNPMPVPVDEIPTEEHTRLPISNENQETRASGNCNLNGGLVGFWSFDEGTGVTARDDSGLGNQGSLQNMNNNNWVLGQCGNALHFDGGDDYIDCGTGGTLQISGGMTVAAWIKIDTGGRENWIIGKTTDSSPSGNGWCFRIDGNNQVFLQDNGPESMWDAVWGTTTFHAGVWYHAVGVFNADGYTRNRIFINGQSESLSSESGEALEQNAREDSGSPVTIGWLGYGSNYFDGTIDEVRIFNRALSASEVLNLYECLKPRCVNLTVSNGLDYEGEFKEKVFRRGGNLLPSFYVRIKKPGLESVYDLYLDIYKGEKKIRTMNTFLPLIEAIPTYLEVWNDWKCDPDESGKKMWEDSEIPKKIPVGTYSAKARIMNGEEEIACSEKKDFYVIFDSPSSLSEGEKKAYLYDELGTRDLKGIWYGSHPNYPNYDEAVYFLNPFDKHLFNISISIADGDTEKSDTAEKLWRGIANIIFYTSPNGAGGVPAMLQDVTVKQAVDASKPNGVEGQYVFSLRFFVRSAVQYSTHKKED